MTNRTELKATTLVELSDDELQRRVDQLSLDARHDADLSEDLLAAEGEIARRAREVARLAAAEREEARREAKAEAARAKRDRKSAERRLQNVAAERWKNAEQFELALEALCVHLAAELKLAGEMGSAASAIGLDHASYTSDETAVRRIASRLARVSTRPMDFSTPLYKHQFESTPLTDLIPTAPERS